MSHQIVADSLRFPEGPAFDANERLWLVELQGESLVEVTPDGPIRHHVGGAPNGLALHPTGLLWFCDSGMNAIRSYNPHTGEVVIVSDAVDAAPLSGPNDLIFDTIGNLIFTCPGGSWDTPSGYICCRTPSGLVTKLSEGFMWPNGLALLPNCDGLEHLVVAETRRGLLWRGRWDAEAVRWENPAPWLDVSGATGPDGMALGPDGLLYVAIYGDGCILQLDPHVNHPSILRRIDLPGLNPTNIAFGSTGPVVTEAQFGQALLLLNDANLL